MIWERPDIQKWNGICWTNQLHDKVICYYAPSETIIHWATKPIHTDITEPSIMANIISSIPIPLHFPPLRLLHSTAIKKSPLLSFSLHCSSKDDVEYDSRSEAPKKLSEQSSWEAKDSEGRDYLYRLGKEADNMNIAVGARSGVIDDLFTGKFLGQDCIINYFLLLVN